MEERPWLKQYDPGVPQTINYPAITVHGMLEDSARKLPRQPLHHLQRRNTSAEMDALTDRLAAGLAEQGIKKGDRVGIFMPNTPQFVIAYFAVLKAGGVVVATNPLYTERDRAPGERCRHRGDVGDEQLLQLDQKSPAQDQNPQADRHQYQRIPVPGITSCFTLTKEKKGGFAPRSPQSDVDERPDPTIIALAAPQARAGARRCGPVPVFRRHHGHFERRHCPAPQPGCQCPADPLLDDQCQRRQ